MYDIDPSLLFPYKKKLKASDRLTGKYKTKWIESSIHANEAESPLTYNASSHIGNSFSLKKIRYFGLSILLFVFLILARLLYLQIINGESYRALAENNRQRVVSIESERGLIYDRNGVELVKNIPNFSLTLIPQDLPKKDYEFETVIDKLAKLTGQDRSGISEILKKYQKYRLETVVIQENIDYEKALAIYAETADLPGIQIHRGSKRLYIENAPESSGEEKNISSLSHVIGYQAKLTKEELDELYNKGYLPSDSIGKVGIEKKYEAELRGVYGKRRTEVDALGRQQNILAEYKPEPGKHLRLSIDYVMQEKLEEILKNVLKKNKKYRASAIAMDPNNGEVLALVSMPAFNNNDFSGGIKTETYNSYANDENQPLFNRAIAGTYPSGSTIKLAIGGAALQEGIITPLTTFLSTGGISVGPWFFPDWQEGGHGLTNLRKSIAWSVNTFYYYIGGGYGDSIEGLGLERIIKYLEKFGFGSRLGIDLPGESSGFLPTREWKKEVLNESWYIGDTYNLSIGQGHLLVTPLQIASLTAIVANGGALHMPNILKSIIEPSSGKIKEAGKQKINDQVIDKENIMAIARGMKDCVEYGSCRYLSSLPFSLAGKTGTAQWNKEKPDHAWFTSFAPFERPEIVLTIMIEEGGSGSSICVPIAYEFYKWWWEYIH